MKVIIAAAVLASAPAFAEMDDATKKALENVQFENAARICGQHVASTLADGSSRYERGFEECITIMQRKAMRDANPENFK